MSRTVNRFIELMGEDRISAITDDGNEVTIIGLPRAHHFNRDALVKCSHEGISKVFSISQLQCNGIPALEALHDEICLY